MKSYILFFACGLVLLYSCQKRQNVPASVEKGFLIKYPQEKAMEWDYEHGLWEVDFKQHGQKFSAVFDKKGHWIETEHDIDKSELPLVIMESLKQRFETFEVDEVEIVESAKGTFYDIEIEYNRKDIELRFDNLGNLTKEYSNTVDDD